MKRLLLTIFTWIGLFLPPTICAEWSNSKDLGLQYDDQILQIEQQEKAISNLQLIKSLILNGGIKEARYLLEKLPGKDKMSEVVKYRYLILIDFIEGRLNEGELLLENFPAYRDSYFKEMCLLQTIYLLSLGKIAKAIPRLETCLRMNQDYLRKDGLWAEMILRIKRQDPLLFEKKLFSHWFPDLDFIPIDVLITWFKLGLYFGQEKEIKPLLLMINEEALENSELRELIALYYYRLGDWDLAKDLAENVNTPNAENILGNILLKDNQYELAFGHFKLAQKYKRNSLNAIERGVPLSWILGQWEDGEKMAQKLPSSLAYYKQKTGILAAFALQMEHFSDVEKYLSDLDRSYGENLPVDLNLIGAYYGLLTANNDKLRHYSELACRQFDGASCLLLMQSSLWPKLSQMLLSHSKPIKDKEFSVEELKQEVEFSPINDVLYIDQHDIEEFDNAEYENKFFSR